MNPVGAFYYLIIFSVVVVIVIAVMVLLPLRSFIVVPRPTLASPWRRKQDQRVTVNSG